LVVIKVTNNPLVLNELNELNEPCGQLELTSRYKNKHQEFINTLSLYPQAMTVLIASLLGDGELNPVTRGYGSFRAHHGVNQYEWIMFKAGYLPPEPFFKIINYKDGSFCLTSQSHPIFSLLERHFYREHAGHVKNGHPYR